MLVHIVAFNALHAVLHFFQSCDLSRSVNCCATQRASATSAGSGEEAVATLLLCDLRARMGFLLENLYYYMQVQSCCRVHPQLRSTPRQVDVVDGEYQTLTAALDSSQDFESLQSSLDQFLKALHVQCFLSSPLVCLSHRRVSLPHVTPFEGQQGMFRCHSRMRQNDSAT